MSEKASIIFEELNQLCAQYKAEVPGARRAWPVSIRGRIFELRKMGLSFIEISKRSVISIATMYAWKAKAETPSFVPVKIVEKKPPTVTVRKQEPIDRKVPDAASTVTVVTPSGFRIENFPVKQVANLFLILDRGGAK